MSFSSSRSKAVGFLCSVQPDKGLRLCPDDYMAISKRQSVFVTIPNIITIARLFLVPMIVWLLVDGRYETAFWAFLAAGMSDAVDGIIARKFDMQSELGAHLDPLADKALLVSIYVTMGMMEEIPAWIVIAVVSRDILIVGAVILSWVMDQPVAMKPLVISKANTTMQIIFAGVVLADLGVMAELSTERMLLGYVVAALTISSAGAYLLSWLAHMGRSDS
jgi:cardiolipin synthase